MFSIVSGRVGEGVKGTGEVEIKKMLGFKGKLEVRESEGQTEEFLSFTE